MCTYVSIDTCVYHVSVHTVDASYMYMYICEGGPNWWKLASGSIRCARCSSFFPVPVSLGGHHVLCVATCLLVSLNRLCVKYQLPCT